MFNTSAFNTTAFNSAGSSGAYSLVYPSWSLELNVTGLIDCAWGTELAVSGTADADWTLDLAVSHSTVTPSWVLELGVHGVVDASWETELAVYKIADIVPGQPPKPGSPPSAVPVEGIRWRPRVWVGAVEMSDLIYGVVEVDAEAGAAAVARVSLLLEAGESLLLSDWIDAGIRIAYQPVLTLPKITPSPVTLFNGKVSDLVYDDVLKLISLTCVDRWDKHLGSYNRAAGSWSEAFFNVTEDEDQTARDRLSTLCADYDLSRDGTPRRTYWISAADEDWEVKLPVSESVVWGFARQNQLIKKVEVSLNYRFTRARVRAARFSYEGDINDIETYRIAPPPSDLLFSAAEQTDWTLNLPVTLVDASGWDGTISLPRSNLYARSAAMNFSRRFTQSCTLPCVLTFGDAGAKDEHTREISGALEHQFDADAWVDDTTRVPLLSPPAVKGEVVADAILSGGSLDPTKSEWTNAQETGYAIATRMIVESHRRNSVQFQQPLNPFLDRRHRVKIDLTTREATGKIQRLVQRMDTGSGAAVSEVTLALFDPMDFPNNLTFDPLVWPAIPTISAPALDGLYILGVNHVGAIAASPDYDENWSGWVANVPATIRVENYYVGIGQYFTGTLRNPAYRAEKAYPQAFRIRLPEIDAAARDNLTLDTLYGDAVPYLPAREYTITA